MSPTLTMDEKSAAEPSTEVGSGLAFALAATFTAEPLEPVLRFWMRQFAQTGAVEFAPFNQVFQALLDPGSLLSRQNFVNAILIRLEDWVELDHSSLSAAGWKDRLMPIVDEFLSAIGTSNRPAPTLVVVCPPSTPLAASREIALCFDEFTARIVSALNNNPGVYAFAPADVARLYPVADDYDAGADALGKIPYTPLYFAALGTFLARMAFSIRRPPFKVIALDCDNTLWSGVCGEAGAQGVVIGDHFGGLQRFMSGQIDQGKLLCICSKNVESDVFDVFDRRADMILKRGQFVSHRINWQPKSGNIRDMARELKLGIDSFIFLDDNPVECAEVRASYPDVLTLQLPDQPERIAAFLRHVWAFDQLRVTDQDRQRTQSYVQNAHREAARRDSASLEEFLARLQLQVTISPVDPPRLPRTAQLTERTNQFNVSTIRRAEPQIQQLLSDGRHRCEVIEVKDRFGDYGLVGVVISRRDATAIVADTLLLSCRVLGRGVEHRMLARLGEMAGEANLPFVEIPFIRTKKNQPVLDFLNRVAMDYRTSTADGFLYRLPADFAAAVKATVATAAPDDSPDPAGAPEASGDRAAQLAVYQRIGDEWTTPEAILAEIESDRRRTREDAGAFAAPADPRQQKMAEIWQRILGIDRIGIRDDYFKLGGTSLLAVRLVLEIEKTFARQLPIAVLLRAPTIEKLCVQLDAPVEFDDLAIVTLRSGGSGAGPPLFLLPGIGGHVMSYRRLSELMEGTPAIHGLEMRPEIESNRRPRAMEAIADEFCRRLRTFQPDGPYLLAGWSFGGSLAFAMARQLQQEGHSVGLVALFDTFCHGYPAPVARGEIIRRHAANLWRLSAVGKLRYVAEKLSFTAGVLKHRTLRLLGVRKTDFHIYKVPEVEEMVAVCDAAWNAYRPTALAGKLTLIRATERPQRIGVSFDDPYNGWGALAGGGVEVYPVESGHMKLFEEPAVHAVAAALSTALGRAISVR